MMYNEDLKKRYIVENGLSENDYIMFENSSSYEQKFEKDLCDFNVNEIIGMYRGCNLYSIHTIENRNFFYKKYTEFCMSENIVTDSQNHFDEITNEIMGRCINKFLLKNKRPTKQNVLDLVVTLANPSEAFTVLAIFEGLYKNDFLDIGNATIDKFDFDNKTYTRDNGDIINVSDELLKYAKLSANEYVYYCSNSDQRNYDADDNRIIKKMFNSAADSDYNTTRRVRSILVRISNQTGFEWARQAKAIKEAGRIHMIKCLMKDNPGMPIRDMIFKYKTDIEYYYGIFPHDYIDGFINNYGWLLEEA